MRVLFSATLCIALAACGTARQELQLRPEAENVGTLHEIFAVTNRSPSADGGFSAERDSSLSYLETQISIPPTHEPGKVQTDPRNPNPARHIVVAEQTKLESKALFERALRNRLAKQPAAEREFTLFVHGFNTSYSEGLFRLAQVQHDMEPPGVPVLFSWPSAARVVGYAYDHDSMIFSRDAVQNTLFSLNKLAPRRTLLVAHSMGSMLSMEALRQIEIGQPGWSHRNLAGVVLIAPDIDIDVFLSQLESFERLPQPFVVFVSNQDRALELSGVINGRTQRLGRASDIEELRDYPILVIDISEFASGRGADHFTVGSSPELIEFLGSPELRNVVDSQEFKNGVISASGQLVRTTAKRAQKAIQWILFPSAAES